MNLEFASTVDIEDPRSSWSLMRRPVWPVLHVPITKHLQLCPHSGASYIRDPLRSRLTGFDIPHLIMRITRIMLIATAFYRRLYIAGLIASKQGQSYSNALQFIQCKISFFLIDSSMNLRGPQSSLHAPANEINFSDHPINLVRREARLGD